MYQYDIYLKDRENHIDAYIVSLLARIYFTIENEIEFDNESHKITPLLIKQASVDHVMEFVASEVKANISKDTSIENEMIFESSANAALGVPAYVKDFEMELVTSAIGENGVAKMRPRLLGEMDEFTLNSFDNMRMFDVDYVVID